jgi:ATP-dependent Clp protease ATP-binding subunit ClpA
MVFARDEARSLKHSHVGCEHFLLGLLREQEGIAARVLASREVTRDRVRAEVARLVSSGRNRQLGDLPLSPDAKVCLELALREAQSLGYNRIGTEHLLLGLLRERDGIAAHIFDDMGLDRDGIRHEVIGLLRGGAHEAQLRPRTLRVSMSGRPAPPRAQAEGRVHATARVRLSEEAEMILGRAAMEALANERGRVAARDLLVGLMASDTPLGAALRALVESDASAAKTLRGILEQAGPYPD